MLTNLALHRAIVQHKSGRIYLVREEEPARKRSTSPEEGVIRTAAAVLMLASYRNQCLHLFVRPAMLATTMHITKTTKRGICGPSSPVSASLLWFELINWTLNAVFVHRWALHVLLLSSRRLLQWVHLHPWKVISGNNPVSQGWASSEHYRAKITKRIIVPLNHIKSHPTEWVRANTAPEE